MSNQKTISQAQAVPVFTTACVAEPVMAIAVRESQYTNSPLFSAAAAVPSYDESIRKGGAAAAPSYDESIRKGGAAAAPSYDESICKISRGVTPPSFEMASTRSFAQFSVEEVGGFIRTVAGGRFAVWAHSFESNFISGEMIYAAKKKDRDAVDELLVEIGITSALNRMQIKAELYEVLDANLPVVPPAQSKQSKLEKPRARSGLDGSHTHIQTPPNDSEYVALRKKEERYLEPGENGVTEIGVCCFVCCCPMGSLYSCFSSILYRVGQCKWYSPAAGICLIPTILFVAMTSSCIDIDVSFYIWDTNISKRDTIRQMGALYGNMICPYFTHDDYCGCCYFKLVD